jgi:hypothetical protein
VHKAPVIPRSPPWPQRERAQRVIRAGYPKPETQIPVQSADARRQYYLDIGWRSLMLALKYDGEHHRSDPAQYPYDVQRSQGIAEVG